MEGGANVLRLDDEAPVFGMGVGKTGGVEDTFAVQVRWERNGRPRSSGIL